MSSYQVFARKYRPQTFDSVVGQDHITQTLKNAIAANRLAHAYLFVGPRGTGKTSTARILAKALNCVHGPTVNPCGECDVCREIAAGNSLDVLEIDGASNNGVEQVRELRENVRFAPTRGKYKVYIIDEVHMLTSAAFNALLKTLEEPPEHVKFIFATTDVQKVLPTILSRCQRFDLRRIPAELIAGHLAYIANEERIALAPDAARTIARGAEGGLRDAESMLDQLVAFCGETIEEADVLSVFGFTASETVSSLCDHLLDGDAPSALGVVQQQAEAGRDLSRLMADLIGHFRNLLVAKADPEGIKAEVGESELVVLQDQAGRIALDRLLELIEQFAAAEGRMKWAPNKKLHFEIAVIKAIQTLGQASLSEVIEALSALQSGGEVKLPAARTEAPKRTTPRPPPKPSAPPTPAVVAAPKPPVTPVTPPREEKPTVVAPEPPKPVAVPEPPKVVAPEPPVKVEAPVVPVAEVKAPEPKVEKPSLAIADDLLAPWDDRPSAPAPVSEPVVVKAEPVAVKAEPLPPEPKPEPEPLLIPEPEPLPELLLTPEPELIPEPVAEPVLTPAAVSIPEPEPEPEPEAIAVLEPTPALRTPVARVARVAKAPEPEPALAAASTDDLWPRLVLEVRDNKPLWRAWIDAGTLLCIEGSVATIGFPKESAFAMESLSKPTPRKFLEQTLSKLAGLPLTVQFEARAGLAVVPVKLPERLPPPVVDPMEEFRNDPFIRKALEIFKAEIQIQPS